VEKLLLRDIERPDSASLDAYLAHGGYRGLTKALSMSPDEVIAEVKASAYMTGPPRTKRNS